MNTPELIQKIDLLPQESYEEVESLVEQLFAMNVQMRKENAFNVFMEKMDAAEKSVEEQGGFSEEEVEAKLAKI